VIQAYPDPDPGWITEGIADYLRWAIYESTEAWKCSGGCDPSAFAGCISLRTSGRLGRGKTAADPDFSSQFDGASSSRSTISRSRWMTA
jgi:hypothetical protein